MTEAVARKKLTNKQRAFVEEYLRDFNATQAAIRSGYSERTAAVIGHENIRKPNVAAYISQRLQDLQMSADEALIILADQGRANLSDFYKLVEEWTYYPLPTDDIIDAKEIDILDEEGKPTGEKKISYWVQRVSIDTYKLLDPQYAKLLKSFSDSPKYGMKIELHDKQSAADKILRVAGKYIDRTDITSKGESINQNSDEFDERRNRALATLADAIREGLHNTGKRGESPVDAAEHPSMASGSNEG